MTAEELVANLKKHLPAGTVIPDVKEVLDLSGKYHFPCFAAKIESVGGLTLEVVYSMPRLSILPKYSVYLRGAPLTEPSSERDMIEKLLVNSVGSPLGHRPEFAPIPTY
jgi:hypothetical protein